MFGLDTKSVLIGAAVGYLVLPVTTVKIQGLMAGRADKAA
jgi:hypothetical protein